MSGDRKVKTGIQLVDDVTNQVIHDTIQIGNGLNDLHEHGKRTITGLVNETGYSIKSGDWSNYLQALGKYAPWLGSDLYKNAGIDLQGGIDKKKQELADQQVNDENMAVQAAQEAQTRQLTGTIAGIVGQRRRTPGRQQSLLTGAFAGDGTLLTSTGG